MKLITNIRPRRDGTVVVHSLDGKKKWTFEADAAGDLVAEVDDDATVAALLRAESAYPADEADFNRAEALLGQRLRAGASDDALDEDGVGDGIEDEGSPDAAPTEAGTPRSGRGRKSKG